VCFRVPAGVLRLQDVQQELLDVAGGELVDVLRCHVSSSDLQLMLHGLNDPSGNSHEPHMMLKTTKLTLLGSMKHQFTIHFTNKNGFTLVNGVKSKVESPILYITSQNFQHCVSMFLMPYMEKNNLRRTVSS